MTGTASHKNLTKDPRWFLEPALFEIGMRSEKVIAKSVCKTACVSMKTAAFMLHGRKFTGPAMPTQGGIFIHSAIR
jgi:hypothetical protein